jgi:hypothetical protein
LNKTKNATFGFFTVKILKKREIIADNQIIKIPDGIAMANV